MLSPKEKISSFCEILVDDVTTARRESPAPQQESSTLCCDAGAHVPLPPAHLPPAYITASMMEEIQETLLLDALKMTSISLKNTVMDLGKA